MIVDFEDEGEQVSIDWADDRVEVVDREVFLAWVNDGYRDQRVMKELNRAIRLNEAIRSEEQ